jgi:hypothetical protein
MSDGNAVTVSLFRAPVQQPPVSTAPQAPFRAA